MKFDPTSAFFKIKYYHDFISPRLARHLLLQAAPVKSVTGLSEVGIAERNPDKTLETTEALQFMCDLYQELQPDLNEILKQRIADRRFMDERVKACHEFNQSLAIDFTDPNYKTILGLEDAKGRVVAGPLNKNYCRPVADKPVAAIPAFLKGPHVTLFGPPGTAKMAINAMNTYHRRLKDEPPIIETLLKTHASVPKWGADDEDSKTPLRSDLISSGKNLSDCFTKNISFSENETGKKYDLAKDHLSVPIKRFPGLALPCTFLFFNEDPVPLHLYDFALHFFKNHNNPEALVFYVPKLETEEEARYIHKMIFLAEQKIQKLKPDYIIGTVRLMIVLENPRAILRAHEIMDALFPYFVGASLGWHDYLASTARLFKNDSNYRIPVKADPNIVIKYIKASHDLLADVVGSRGGIKVGGMYGILPLDNDRFSDSFQVTLKGFIKDVVTQMKRDLTGFWVAHPDFVRLGLAIVEAWKFHAAGNSNFLTELVRALLKPEHHQEIFDFIKNPDVQGLSKDSPNYVRSLLVADIAKSDYIANNHPDEIRYNVFQSLQYLTDWLCGNGCVALPANVGGVAVRVMDDLATAERSRWEVWHEIHHGRFSKEDFLKIAFEELHFIRKDLSDSKKIVQVKWTEETAKWYPVAFKLMIQLMTDENPAEFATELLMPFTVESIRDLQDPWAEVCKIDSDLYRLETTIEKFIHYFEICGCKKFAELMARDVIPDLKKAENIIFSFSKEEIIEAAYFHGNIGEAGKTLDAQAAAEQALVLKETETVKIKLLALGQQYLNKFGFKFLISAKSKTAAEILSVLELRLLNTYEQELENARIALWHISLKRLLEKPLNSLDKKIELLKDKYNVSQLSLSVSVKNNIQSFNFGSEKPTWFELASLSKTLASAFAIEYFSEKNISLDAIVDDLFSMTPSTFRLKNKCVTLKHLMNHSALNMHYVKGYPLKDGLPDIKKILSEIDVISEPGRAFHYSGGGFVVLEHLIESLEKKSIQELTTPYFQKLGIAELTFHQLNIPGQHYASGYNDDGTEVNGSRLVFPAFAAGAMGTARGMAQFLQALTTAYNSLNGVAGLTHDTAVEMLFGTDKGCREFMGCDMGLGVFTAECGENRLALHQGANEGFRCLYVHVYHGPDHGKGFVLLCNADKKGVLFLSEVAQALLKELDIAGVNFEKFQTDFNSENISSEQLVNQGYKNLIFKAFSPTLPDQIIQKGPLNALAEYSILTSAEIINVSNQRFARAENMISAFDPTFDPELFCVQGKVMDSWESARHNVNESDFVILNLKKQASVRFVHLSTKYHDGNQAEFVRISGFEKNTGLWLEILPKFQMLGHAFANIALPANENLYQQIKIEMFPDGGLSRVRLFESLSEKYIFDFKPLANAVSTRFSDEIPKTHKPLSLSYEFTESEILRNKSKLSIDLAGKAFGAKLIRATNEHYGPAAQAISPFPPIHMFDGLESARSRKKDHFEEIVLQLADESHIKKIILDFQFFINNNPRAISIEALGASGWIELVAKTDVKAFAGNKKEFKIISADRFSQIKLKTFPDGGINRISIY